MKSLVTLRAANQRTNIGLFDAAIIKLLLWAWYHNKLMIGEVFRFDVMQSKYDKLVKWYCLATSQSTHKFQQIVASPYFWRTQGGLPHIFGSFNANVMQ
jgi:hypothetical protein